MNRQFRSTLSLGLCVLTLVSGCKPTQPYFFAEDGKVFGKGDLSHYMNVATELEYPDVENMPLEEVTGTQAPLTLSNAENFDIWDLSLEEVTRITLTNSKVIRQLGGRITDGGSNIANATPRTLQQGAAQAVSVYDPAIVESGNGTGSGSALDGTGVEAALSEFDAMWDASATWNKNDRPFNFGIAGLPNIFATRFAQDLGTYSTGLTKNTANGSTFGIRHNVFYDSNNNGSRVRSSDFFTNLEASFNQPLLQGAGTEYNRIAGFNSFQTAASGMNQQIDGVLIARVRHDVALTDFEEGVHNLMKDVEDAYWELYFAYRDLDARKIGRDSALETWLKVKALKGVGTQGGEADKEAQARSQYYLFRSQVETALTNLFRIENRMRYMMGLAASDGRLIRPIDEPTTARIDFDWSAVQCEALARRTELRSQKWQIKRREMELIATKNNLMPRLDASGTYRFLGAGEDLITSSPNGVDPFADGSNAYESLSTGDFQEWQLGVQFTLPIGFRRALAGVRHHQLLLARERAVLEDMELEVTHQMSDSVRDVDFNFQNLQTNFNRRVASQDEVDAVKTVYESGRVPIDLLLDAQRWRAEAESAYYRSLVDYNRAIMLVHYSKGSLLEYNGVYLAEGPWPGKAQFDALRVARQRDGSTFINYGCTKPGVISRGPHAQRMGGFDAFSGAGAEMIPSPAPVTETPQPAAEQPVVEPPATETLPLPGPTDTGSTALPGVQPLNLAALPAVGGDVEFNTLPVPEDLPVTAVQPTSYALPSLSTNYEPNALRQENPSTETGNPFRSTALPVPTASQASPAVPGAAVTEPGKNPLRQPTPAPSTLSNGLRSFDASYESETNLAAPETPANPASGQR